MTENEKQIDSGSSTSRSLVMRLKDEDAVAWRDLVHLYSPLIIYWCRKQGANDRDCEDILQDVFRTVVTSIDSFTKDKPSSTFRGWLRTITRSRIADFYRRTSKEPNADGGTEAQMRFGQLAEKINPSKDDEDATHEDPSEYESLYQRAIDLIRGEFQQQTWTAFWRTAVDGCSASDVADELGMRPGTVRVAKSRVLQRLRDRLGDLLD